jgi:hypothetical protein
LGEFSPIWRSFSLGSFFENCKSSTNSWATFVHGTSYALNRLGYYILGDFFTNSSSHPDWRRCTFWVIHEIWLPWFRNKIKVHGSRIRRIT